MKKVILYGIGLIAVLWIALFVSGQQVLVWETSYSKEDCEDENHSLKWKNLTYKNVKYELAAPSHFAFIDSAEFTAKVGKILSPISELMADFPEDMSSFQSGVKLKFTCEDITSSLDCRYFNGRKIIRKHRNSMRYDSCPNFRKNR